MGLEAPIIFRSGVIWRAYSHLPSMDRQIFMVVRVFFLVKLTTCQFLNAPIDFKNLTKYTVRFQNYHDSSCLVKSIIFLAQSQNLE